MARQLAYWKEALAGAPTGFKMRGDFAGPPTANSPGGALPVALPTDLVRSLKSLAAACGATLFVVVLTAWKVPLPTASFASRGRCPCACNKVGTSS